jgi:P-type E1-E2 ATPase
MPSRLSRFIVHLLIPEARVWYGVESGAIVAIKIEIPGERTLELAHLVLDVNGTLACDGVLEPGVVERIARLREQLEVHLLTADTHGGQAAVDAALSLRAIRIRPGQERAQKAAFLRALPGECAACGNGANDAAMLEAAALGIAVLGREGLCRETLEAADVLTLSAVDALDLLLHPARLRATLRR